MEPSAFSGSPQMAPDTHPWLEMSFVADLLTVRQVLLRVRAALDDARVPVDQGQQAELVLAEVFNNIVEHAYGADLAGPVDLRIWRHGTALICHVRDRGQPMPGRHLPGGGLPTLDPDAPQFWPEGGFGWGLVHDLTHYLAYRRVAGENNLRFCIGPDCADSSQL